MAERDSSAITADPVQGDSKHTFANKKMMSLISSIDINSIASCIYCSSDSYFCAFIHLFSSFLAYMP